jgi:large subunit ribosomal protein L5
MASRLRTKFQSEVVPALMQEFNYTSVMQVPHLVKIVLNIGMGEAIQNAKSLDAAVGDLAAIAGQKPVVTRAKKAIAAFKLRQGMPIGAMVTLRGDRMYQFLDRFINLALPRVRDFRGINRRSFDGRGNYTIGLREQILFPEIDYDKVDKLRGMEISIVTSAVDDAQGYALLKRLGMPFRD